jgi:ketosteroid isomerase-like protein
MSNADDVVEISSVLARYSRAMDARQWHLMDDVFTDDATQEMGGLLLARGRKQIVDTIRAAIECCSHTHHMNSNIDASIDGDTAHVVSNFRAWHRGSGTRSDVTYEAMGTYTDEFVRTAAGWRIRGRIEDNPIEIGSADEIFADAADVLAAVSKPG